MWDRPRIFSTLLRAAPARPATGSAHDETPRSTRFCAAALGLAITLAATPATAATITVNTSDDEINGDGDCSLREAIRAANMDTAVDACPPGVGADEIFVPAGSYLLTIEGRAEDAAASGDLDITSDLTLTGAGADATVIDANGLDRVFHVDPAGQGIAATIRGVTMRGGATVLISFVDSSGGGILLGVANTLGGTVPSGTLALADSVVRDNAGARDGGGIANKGGTLALVNSRVVINTGAGGGAIVNDGRLTMDSSTLSGNTAGGGGAIWSLFQDVTITNSTISDNRASGSGGGIGNYRAAVRIINSTISGNVALGYGGGVYNEQGTVALNSSTLTDNSAGTPQAGGAGGGILAGGSFVVTLSNTIVAGNRPLDCDGRLSSSGYNLVERTTLPFSNPSCTLEIDPTGNILGLDAGLGPLANNGGAGETHALLAESPAIDSGNPAVPGSGAAACAVTDQRSVLRPVGATCDIGAVEREGELGIDRLVPNRGGNAGPLLAVLSGNRFASGATVTLARGGEPDIVGSPVVFAGDVLLSTTFDLTGRRTGPWDIVVTNPDATSTTLPGGFTIEETRAPELWINIVGRPFVRASRGPTLRYLIVFGNRGNVDAIGVPLGLSIPSNVGFQLRFEITPPPAHDGQVATEWNRVPIDVFPDAETGGATNIPLLLPIVPAGFTGALEMTLTFPTTAEPGETFLVLADLDRPLFNPSLSPQAVDTFVRAAQAYAEQNLQVTIPPAVVPDLERYITDQLTSVVANGRGALLDTFGKPTQVYSLTQLDIDLARYGAARSAASAVSAADFIERVANWTPSSPRVIVAAISYLGSSPAEAACPPSNQCCPPGSIPAGCMCRPCDPPTPAPVDTPGPGGTITKGTCINLGRRVSADGKFCKSPECGDAPVNVGITTCTKIPIKDSNSIDPNDKVGALGVDDARFLSGDTLLPYAVFFENLQTATAAAQEVTITDQLDVDRLDLDTLSLGPISFGTLTITPPPGLSEYTGGVDLRPRSDLLVTVDARLDKSTGRLTWRFASIDPDTLQLTEDALAGFLPPNVNPPEGDGSVVFTVQPKPGLPTGTEIRNRATIVFDVNPPIDTPEWRNTIDATPPQSHVLPLPRTQTDTAFPVRWEGSDEGAGIGDFTIYVSEDGGAFTPLVSSTTDTSLVFTGQDGKTYAFCSISRDLTGTVEEKDCAAADVDATTTISTRPLCVGDCDADGSVSIAELVTAVNIALDRALPSRCPASDPNHDDGVRIEELVTAVSRALNGCSGASGA